MAEWIGTLVASSVGVTLGFFLSIIRGLCGARKRRKNMESLLFMELSRNYRRLIQVLPKEGEGIPAQQYVRKVLCEKHPYLGQVFRTDRGVIPPPTLLAEVCDGFSLAVYDNYLDRMDTLSKDQVGRVYAAYYDMRQTWRDSKPMLEVPLQFQKEERQKRNYMDHAVVLICTCEQVAKAMAAALRCLEGGEGALLALESERGTQMEAYEKGRKELSGTRECHPQGP